MPTARSITRFSRRSHAERLAARHACRARDIAGHWNGSWSARQWESLLAESEYTCYLCGEPLDPDDATPDHIVPLVRGGRNVITNLAPAHAHCNSRKGDKTLTEFRAYQAHQEKQSMHPHPATKDAVLSAILPRHTRRIVLTKLIAAIDTIAACHGNPDRWLEERAALGRLAQLSELIFDDANFLPGHLRPTLLEMDLEAVGEEVA